MPNPDTPLPAPTELEEAALAWFARCQRGLGVAEEAEFERWLAADPRHAVLFNEIDGSWTLLGRVGTVVPSVERVSVRRVGWRRFAMAFAAAAAMALAYMGWWRPAHYAGETATPVGGLRTLQLPDGTTVTLNTDSALAAAFSPEERRVRLQRGEAHFSVAKNPARPFIVEAGGVSVRAVGTAFNVRLDAGAVEVLVTEGRVSVNDATSGRSLLARDPSLSDEARAMLGPPVLSSGHKVVVSRPAPIARPEPSLAEAPAVAVAPDDIRRELAWQERRLDFELVTLGEIVAEFNRYSQHRLIVIDPVLAAKRFGGSFRPDDQAGFVRMLQENYGVRVEESESATILRSGR